MPIIIYFVHLRAEALYKMNKYRFTKLLKEEKSLKESLYHNLEKSGWKKGSLADSSYCTKG